ncbi:MAG: ABC transporter permease [Candidatus Pacebacteria bacterium]|nr:ABC transporter permease [Candidatus Paceibacterota bacterium]
MSMDFSKIKKSVKLAFSGLGANKTRTGLSVLGIVIGVASVIMIVSVGQGLQAFILGQLSSFGSDIISVQPKVPGGDFQNSLTSMGQGVVITSLKSSDAEDLRDKDRFPYIGAASGYASAQEWAVYQEKEKQLLIIAADAYYPEIDALTVTKVGRFFTQQENDSMAKVIIIGSDIAKEFFGSSDPIGKSIRIKDNNFEVKGVLKERGSVLSFNMDELVIIPIKTSQKLIQGVDHIQEIGIKLEDEKYLAQAKSEIASLMRENHNIDNKEDDDFQIITMDETLATIDSITGAISLLLGLLAAISLFVGGIGIMNIMLVIVAERTREIGLRKAVGARHKDIMQQFILEAVAISLAGGFIGIVIGVSLSFISSQLITRYAGLDWPFVISYGAIAVSFLVAAFFGIVFGWYPAKEAAKLSPIEALRKN